MEAIGTVYVGEELCYNPDIEHTGPLSRSVSGQNASGGAHFPGHAYHEQDGVFRRAFDVLNQAVVHRSFPGASVAIAHRKQMVALKALGRFTHEAGAPEVTTASIFDLASVSKVVATTTMAMILYERGLLDLEMAVSAVIPEFAAGDARRREVTLHMLLAHSSGLPGYEKLFLRAEDRGELLAAVFATPLAADPGTKAEYSDLGFIALGVALERIADETLDRFCQREIFGPLGMTHTTFNPRPALRSSIPPTMQDRSFRHRVVQGEVHDENASVLGGVAGHAGLFATAQDLATFAQAMLEGGSPILRPDTIAVFTRREREPRRTSRALGWDTPSFPSQSGKHFSPSSFGHLGYTGTSLWIDPKRQLSVTLLTNRTWPDGTNDSIKQVRPAFHDAVLEAVEAGR